MKYEVTIIILHACTGETIFSHLFDSCLQDDQVTLACEVLKTLFNLTVKHREQQEAADDAWYRHLASILHDFLLSETHSREKLCELRK
jgi:ribosomal protein S19E (S16A)